MPRWLIVLLVSFVVVVVVCCGGVTTCVSFLDEWRHARDDFAIPKNFPGDIPIHSDLSKLSLTIRIGFEVRFQGKSDVHTILEYYRKQMPKNGWTENGFTDADGDHVQYVAHHRMDYMEKLAFEKEDRRVLVLVGEGHNVWTGDNRGWVFAYIFHEEKK